MAGPGPCDVHLPVEAILRVLQGVQVAVKAPNRYVDPIADCLRFCNATNRDIALVERSAPERDTASLSTRSMDEWRSYLEPNFNIDVRGIWAVVDVTLAVTYLREKARKDLALSPSDIDTVWTFICRAVRHSEGSGLEFSAARSAQGFLAVALCSLVEDGKIKELWRLHVWLPDRERGVSEVVIHAHQPFAQSWILAGYGTDHTYDAQTTDNIEEATHALYDCCYVGSGQSESVSSGYKTHQLSSTISNTGKYVQISPIRSETHTRDMSYTVPSGMYHKSEVCGTRFHATLFVFDASKGFDDAAGVLGPIDGESFTQLRDSKGLTARVLVQIAEASRSREQEHSLNPDALKGEHSIVNAYYRFFRGMDLIKTGDLDEAMRFFTSGDGNDPAHAFASAPSPRHRQYVRELINVGVDVDVADQRGFTVLDYAVCEGDDELKEILLTTLRGRFGERKADRRLHEAHVRKAFRNVFEKQLRPILLRREPDGLYQMRHKYAGLLESCSNLRRELDGLRYLTYADFLNSSRLPRYTDGVLRTFGPDSKEKGGSNPSPEHLVFIAYRWIHKDPSTGKTANDDKDHTQFERMRRAIEEYLQVRSDVDPARLGIWLDSVCVDRKHPLPGIAALPINLAQCDALITIEDQEFWSRAWCSLEAYTIQKLRRLYPYYNWYRYSTQANEEWSLREASPDEEISMARLNMTWEEDRDKIAFLQRQANLL